MWRCLVLLLGLFGLSYLLPLPALLQAQEPVQEKERLTAEMLELYRQGRYTDAITPARQIVELVRTHQGTDHPDYVIVLANLALLHKSAGDFAVAMPLYREAIEGWPPDLQERPAFTHALTALAQILQQRGDYAGAEPLYRRALEIRERTLGPDHPDYANSLNNLGSCLHAKGDLMAAESILRAALEAWRRVDRLDQPNYAITLINLALLLKDRGDLDSAVPLYREALGVWQRLPGLANPAYAAALTGLGSLLRERGDYIAAEPLLREAVDIRRTLLGTQHPEYAEALAHLSLFLSQTGRYTAAEPLSREVLEIRRQALGIEHPAYASALHNRAILLKTRGELAAAEPLLRQALEIWRQTSGPEHPEYATGVRNLGSLLYDKGDYTAAEPLYREALEIRGRVLGTEHPEYATSLIDLAVLMRERGHYDEAEPLIREALEIRRRALGPDHRYYADALNHLALLFNYRQDYATAEPLYREALAIRRRVLGPTHRIYAQSLSNLATLLHDQGDLLAAEPLLEEAVQVTADAVGQDNPEYINRLRNLAFLNQALGRPDSARILLERVLRIEQRLLEQIFGFTSERGMLAYAAKSQSSLSMLLSMAERQGNAAAAEMAFRWVLLRKGAVLSAMSSYRQVERVAVADPQVETRITRLQDTRQHLVHLALNPPTGVAADSLATLTARLRGERERLEAELSRTLSAHLGTGSELHDADLILEQVRRALPTGSALIEFVRYRRYDFGHQGRQLRSPETHYAALILTASGPVQWMELDEAAEIDRAIRGLREAHMGCEAGEQSQLCSESAYQAAALDAYEMIFGRLDDALVGVERLVISLDGELNQLPLGALVDRDGRYLMERYQFGYVSSGRDLLRGNSSTRGHGTTIFAGPIFDLVPQAIPPATGITMAPATAAETATARKAGRAAASRPHDALRGLKWEELPGARAEASDVEQSLTGTAWGPVTVRIGPAAVESGFKAIRSPRILHVATHGFFIPERNATPEERAQCLAAGTDSEPDVDLETGMGRGIERLRCAEDPLLRSGIVLSGANAVGDSAEDGEDGWVLAEEIALMDLAGTELVVLSACETGRGDVRVGEGVYGLRRAFELAGARKILMSLYKVPDSATRKLLDGFYRRLAAGQDAESALRESQLELKATHPHPFFWASFVLLGKGDG